MPLSLMASSHLFTKKKLNKQKYWLPMMRSAYSDRRFRYPILCDSVCYTLQRDTERARGREKETSIYYYFFWAEKLRFIPSLEKKKKHIYSLSKFLEFWNARQSCGTPTENKY